VHSESAKIRSETFQATILRACAASLRGRSDAEHRQGGRPSQIFQIVDVALVLEDGFRSSMEVDFGGLQ
jgi:hypothetical protein